ncbi:MAG: Omp28-related outer membrane protein [Bacteroidota bacterium]
MKTLQLFFTLSGVFLLTLSLSAQEVPKRIVVEHFTNSRCGICANRNPGFYQNFNNQDDALHISFHPSSPYSNCELHRENEEENDGRTYFNNIYGGTPRLVIQGEAVAAGTNYGNASIFEQHANETTPVELVLRQQKSGNTIQLEVDITAATDNNLGTQLLFLGVAEDTVFYNAPNGEDEHYDVFRQTVNNDVGGQQVTVPAAAGETLSLSYTWTSPSATWDFERLFVVAILQNLSDRSVTQSDATTPTQDNITRTWEPLTLATEVFPNPVSSVVNIQLPTTATARFSLSNLQGQILRSGTFAGETQLDLTALPSSIYQLETVSDGARSVQQLVKE